MSGGGKVDRLARYARQMLVAQLGREAQKELGSARVAVAGTGAIGCATATLLVRGGVGYVRVIDFDAVDLTNLHRQTLYTEADVVSRRPKALIAAERLREANQDVVVEGVDARIAPENGEHLLTGMDLILDGMDNLEARYVVNDVAVKHGIPWIYGGVLGTYGLTMNILPGEGPCLRCLLHDAPPTTQVQTTATEGVLPPIVYIMAGYEVVEAVKILAGRRDELCEGMMQIEVWDREMSVVHVPRRADCPTCVLREFPHIS